MKRIGFLFAAILAASAVIAQEKPAQEKPAAASLDAKTDKLVREAMLVCSDLTLTRADLQQKLPAGLSAIIVRAESPRHSCEGQYLFVTASSGATFLGVPWFLGDTQGSTIEEKVQNFAWTNMQSHFTAVVERKQNRDGLFPVTLIQTTERGKLPIPSVVDPEGKVLFMGTFRPANAEAPATRTTALQPYIATSPVKGAEKADVTIVEFSDFQCPSCKFAAGYADAVLAKHAGRVRYVRYDLPLMSAHPWAFSAAVAGRAIYRQKPEAFWDFKKQIYSNQDTLNAFTIDDFARSFAQDHELNMTKYDADVASAEVRDELLKGIGMAFATHVRATPTYMVNGVYVDPGEDGKALESYVAGLLK